MSELYPPHSLPAILVTSVACLILLPIILILSVICVPFGLVIMLAIKALFALQRAISRPVFPVA